METTTTTKTPWDFREKLIAAMIAKTENPSKEVIMGIEQEAHKMFRTVDRYNDLRKDLKKTYQSIIRSAEGSIHAIDNGFRSNDYDDLGSLKETIVRIHCELGVRREQLQGMARDLETNGIDIAPFDFVI